jgi:zinc transporter, ZIP family
MEAHGVAADDLQPQRSVPAWVAGLLPLVLVALAVGAFAALGGPGLGERTGPPIEELAVERTVLTPGVIELTVRNDGPDPVSVAQAIVNDAFVQFSGAERPIGRLQTETIRVRQPWIEGEGYEVVLLTSTGATIAHEIPAAALTPASGTDLFGLMALLGLYVGVIPVALGMLWLPWVRRIPRAWLRAIMALTVGLLAFLGLDATLEGVELAGTGSQAFGGTALVVMGAVTAYLALSAVGAWLDARRAGARADGAPASRLALLVAVGIGLHNLGEGLAIGTAYATGALALGAFLVIGFAIHNTTEGLAIVAPVAHLRPRLPRLAALGLIAGAPAILGAWIGALRRRRRRDRPGGRPAGAVASRRRRPDAAPGRRRRHPRRHGRHVHHRAAGGGMSAAEHTSAVQDYAKAIYSLQRREDGPVTTNALAARLQVTAASASAMVKKLADRGLVEHAPYKGVALTDAGRRVALETLRHHRLLELFLAEHLDVPWDRVHEEAEALEHVLSEDLEARIAAKLGHPTHDPHGDPIPDAELRIAEDDSRPLTALEPGQRGRFARVSDQDPEMLRYLAERGIQLGEELEVVDRQPFDGPLTVRYAVGETVLGGRLAEAMRVVVG